MRRITGSNPAAAASAAPMLWPALAESWRRTALFLWMTAVSAVTVLSLLPAAAPSGEYGFDKLIHASTYFALALLAHLAFERRKTAAAAAAALIPLGCLIEVAQAFVPMRYGDLWDALANTIGVLAGLVVGARLRRIVAAMTRATRREEDGGVA